MHSLSPYFLLLLHLLCLFPAAAQTAQTARTDTGSIGGASYRIDIPTAWNRKLVMYAHGMEIIGTPPSIKAPHSQALVEGVFLSQGFAVARSAFRRQGWAVAEGIEDTEALRNYFVKKYGNPDSTFITGHSMGAMITIATAEKYGKQYHGFLPICGSSTPAYEQINSNEIVPVFEFYFPGALPSIIELSKPGRVQQAQLFTLKDGQIHPPAQLVKAILSDSLKAQRIATRLGVRYNDLFWVVPFFAEIYRDICLQAGGNPLDNTNKIYSGYLDDSLLNRKVTRLTPDPKARVFLEKTGNFTGRITRPMLLLHTLYDPLIPPDQATRYAELARQAGTEGFFVVNYTTGQGHCTCSGEQIHKAFAHLRTWTKTGQKPIKGQIH